MSEEKKCWCHCHQFNECPICQHRNDLTISNFVLEFHKKFNLPVRFKPGLIPWRELQFRQTLIEEEMHELLHAMNIQDMTKIADGLGDLVYVIYGAALHYGLPLDKIIEEIHKSNMTKIPKDGIIIYREDGKVLKPPTFKKPDLDRILGRWWE